VPDLDRSLRFFVTTLGLTISNAELHRAEHEDLWGLGGARRRTCLLEAGGWWVELVQYESPIGRDWPPGYLLSDIGLFNIGFGSRERAPFLRVQQAVAQAGYTMHAECSRDFFDLRYVEDDQGFGVQINYDDVALDKVLGFVPEDEQGRTVDPTAGSEF
jgi:catechol 2,3-dioxygenase-like lactoylglutathione lyase family enzyme